MKRAALAPLLTLTVIVGMAVIADLSSTRNAAAAKPYSTSASTGGTSFDTSRPLFVNPDSAAETARKAEPDPIRAAQLAKISAQPSATWVGNWWAASTLTDRVAKFQATARSAGATRTYVLYAIPDRDCGSYSAGGLDPMSYRAFVDAFSAGLGSWPAIVIVEPDALAQLDCLSAEARRTRLDLLQYTSFTLTKSAPTSRVYLDAGNSAWIGAPEMAKRLAAAGVAGVRGFALNVSNFHATSAQVSHGQDILARLGGGKGFVIDTSRNGLGAWTGTSDPTPWCNPPGRALGVVPSHAAHGMPAGLDSLLWIKTVGASDGACRSGAPTAGTFWVDYAVGLAERAAW